MSDYESLEAESKEKLVAARDLNTDLSLVKEQMKREFEKYEACLGVAKVYSKYGMEEEKTYLIKVANDHLDQARELKKKVDDLTARTLDKIKEARSVMYSSGIETSIRRTVDLLKEKVDEIGTLKLATMILPIVFFILIYTKNKR